MEALQEIKEEMWKIRGQWNGKDSGRMEDRAAWASEVIELVDELVAKLKEDN